jgi:hypothetical protein
MALVGLPSVPAWSHPAMSKIRGAAAQSVNNRP